MPEIYRAGKAFFPEAAIAISSPIVEVHFARRVVKFEERGRPSGASNRSCNKFMKASKLRAFSFPFGGGGFMISGGAERLPDRAAAFQPAPTAGIVAQEA
jgi:hypothetical protein